MRTRWVMAALFAFLLSLILPSYAAASATPFSDLEGHWASDLIGRAAASGYVNGYPDGSFRPEARVTRAEAVKLLTAAGHLGTSSDDYRPFGDLPPTHWLVAQGYMNAALSYGMVTSDDGGTEYRFRPDEPATRLELLMMASRLLGKPYDDPPNRPDALPFTDAIAEGDRRWVSQGLALGLVQGYPDGSFRPSGSVTRAEAVAIVERTIARMAEGTDDRLSLILNGEPVPDAVLAVRDGWIFAPGEAIYLDERLADWRTRVSIGVWSGVSNDRFAFLQPVLGMIAGSRTVQYYLTGMESDVLELAREPFVRFGHAMIPVAPVGGRGEIPFGEAVHDPATGEVAVTFGADWPGFRLPTGPEDLHLIGPTPWEVGPTFRIELTVPLLADADGLGIIDSEMAPVTFSVDPDGPLRLLGGAGMDPAVTFTSGPANLWRRPELIILPDPTEGQFEVQIASGGYAPTAWVLTLKDDAGHHLVVEAESPWQVGEEATILLRLVDRFGRPVTDHYASTYPYLNWSGTEADGFWQANPQITLIGPDGQEVEVEPVLESHRFGTMSRDCLIVDGVGRFTFTPTDAGTYHVKGVFRPDPDSERGFGEPFEVTPVEGSE